METEEATLLYLFGRENCSPPGQTEFADANAAYMQQYHDAYQKYYQEWQSQYEIWSLATEMQNDSDICT